MNLKQSNKGLKPAHPVVVVVVVVVVVARYSFCSDDDAKVGQIQFQVSLELAPKAVLVHRIDDGPPGGVGQHLEALKVHLTEGQVRLEVVSG